MTVARVFPRRTRATPRDPLAFTEPPSQTERPIMPHSPRCRRITTDALLNQAAEQLPDGWQIHVVVERDAGWVELHTPDGDLVELSPDPQIDGGFPAAIADALEVAKAHAAPKVARYRLDGTVIVEVMANGRDGGIIYDYLEDPVEARRILEVLNRGIGPDWDAVSAELERPSRSPTKKTRKTKGDRR